MKLRVPHTFALLFGLVAVAAVATHWIPAGEFARVEQGGRLIVEPGSYASVAAQPAATPAGAILTRQEKTVMGSYYGSANVARDFPLFADLYQQGKLDLDRLISKTYPLSQINEAYAAMLTGEAARGVIVF